ncbi:MAG: hypothetical protein KDN19_02450 [Verrucomicrobiae bacterium]|nr:hypothetical protein [Verrucomicrobiae bacterium]
MTIEQGQIELNQAAEQVRRRVGRNAFLAWLWRGRWIVPLVALVLVLALRLGAGVRGGEWAPVLGVIAVYAAIGAAWSWARRPLPLRALALWDERGGRKDLFSSAWAFLADNAGGVDSMEEGRKMHVNRAMTALPEARKHLADDLPSPKIGGGWLLTIAVLAFAFTPWLRPQIAPGEDILSDEMTAEAERQSAELAKEEDEIDKITGLTEEEKKEVEKLREAVDGAAEDLADSEGKTAREVLEGLESRARAAERLAEKLGAASEDWASEEMLREMSQHADTADLAASIKDKSAEGAADESDKLAAMLEEPELKLETQERMTSTLEMTMAKATEDDAKKPVGERVGNASRKMQDKQPATAGREFAELAKHFRRVKEREEAEEKLRELADKLRDAGNSISGSKMEKMQQLASSGQQGGKNPDGSQALQPLSQSPTPNTPGMTPMTPTPQPGQQSQGGQQQSIGTNMPIPGMQNPQGQGQQQGQQGGQPAPVPGTGQQGQMQQGLAAGQGQQPGGQQPGMGLMAPIPGQQPGAGMPGASLGAGASAAMGANGGNQAGTGTMGLGNQETEAMKAAQDAKVVTQTNNDGDSTVRAIEGQTRTEQAQRDQQDMIVNFIEVEEEALDEAALPLSRREHVLRYFTALREEFEKSE